MELQKLINDLMDIIALCEQLVSRMESKREAMKALRVAEIEAGLMEEELLLERIRYQDQEFKGALEATARRYGMTPQGLLTRPEAFGLKRQVDRVKVAQQKVQEQGELTRFLAEHVTRFLKQMQGEVPELTYASRLRPSSHTSSYAAYAYAS